jgi:hypothetical protein
MNVHIANLSDRDDEKDISMRRALKKGGNDVMWIVFI